MGAMKEQAIKNETLVDAKSSHQNTNLNLWQRMSLITDEIGYVAKNLKVEYGNTKYKAVSEVDVLNAVKSAEKRHGVYSYPVSRQIIKDDTVVVGTKNNVLLRIETVYRFVNIDNPQEYLDITTYGDGIDSMDKAPGKAMTYGDKYALLKAYKIQTGDDPDANASQDMKTPVQPPVDSAKKISEIQKTVLVAFGIDLDEMRIKLKCKTVDDITYDIAERQIKKLEQAKGDGKLEEQPKQEQVPPEQENYSDPLPWDNGGAE